MPSSPNLAQKLYLTKNLLIFFPTADKHHAVWHAMIEPRAGTPVTIIGELACNNATATQQG